MTSGTLVCMRNAISYWAMRDSISGSSSCSNCWLVERVELVEHRAAAGAADAVGVAEVEHRVLAGAELHALVLRVEEAAAPEAGVERLVAACFAVTSTMNDGRSSFIDPRP